MGSLLSFCFIYVLGGLTFLPLVLLGAFSYAYLLLSVHNDAPSRDLEVDSIVRPGDDVDAIARAQKTLGEKFQPRGNHETEVAAGYFAVSRTYVPGGVGALPPERNTPTGSTTVSAPSPSVYQTMYRSIFDRKPVNSPIESKGLGKPQKRGNNVFYVVLRYWSNATIIAPLLTAVKARALDALRRRRANRGQTRCFFGASHCQHILGRR